MKSHMNGSDLLVLQTDCINWISCECAALFFFFFCIKEALHFTGQPGCVQLPGVVEYITGFFAFNEWAAGDCALLSAPSIQEMNEV